jgi:hypothetical protein
MQENSEVIRSMISHMQSLFTEASFSGWDPAKFAHSCVLTDLEDGIYSWSDSERLAEARRRGVQLRQAGATLPLLPIGLRVPTSTQRVLPILTDLITRR